MNSSLLDCPDGDSSQSSTDGRDHELSEDEGDPERETQIADFHQDITFAVEHGAFKIRVFCWIAVVMILPAVANVLYTMFLNFLCEKDPRRERTDDMRWWKQLPCHFLVAGFLVVVGTSYLFSSSLDVKRARRANERVPLAFLADAPEDVRADRSLMLDVHTTYLCRSCQETKPSKLLPACGIVTILAFVLILAAWIPFWEINMLLQERYFHCMDNNITMFNDTTFRELLECDIRRAWATHSTSTTVNITAEAIANHKAKAWEQSHQVLVERSFYVPFLIESYGLWKLIPFELIGGVLFAAYAGVYALQDIEVKKMQKQATMAEERLRGDLQHRTCVQGRGHQSRTESARELRAKLDKLMKKALDEDRLNPPQHCLTCCIVCILIVQMWSPRIVRSLGWFGRSFELPTRMGVGAFVNLVLVVVCVMHFWWVSRKKVKLYQRSIPRLQLWQATYHSETSALFKAWVESLSSPEQKADIHNNLFFIPFDTADQLDVWRRLQVYVRLQVMRARFEAEGLFFMGAMWLIMIFFFRLCFFFVHWKTSLSPAMWVLSLVDTFVFGWPLYQVLSTSVAISSLKRQDVVYLKYKKEGLTRKESPVSDVLGSIIDLEQHHHPFETLFSVNINQGHITRLFVLLLGLVAESISGEVLEMLLF